MTRSSLSRHLPDSRPDAGELRKMRAAAWHRQGIAVLPIAEIRDDWERRMVMNIANEMYGKRKEEA